MTLGGKIKKFRNEKGFSQQELADKLGVHRKTIVFYEQNKTQPPADILQKMAAIFEVSHDYLLSEESGDASGIIVKDKSLIPTFQEIDNLSEKGKDVVKTVVEGLTLREKTKKK
jgi:transcriptional regulator with XRE-family HTH domain